MARRVIELSGQRFGKLLVISKAHKGKLGEIFWNCVCDCGREVAVRGGHMIRGNSTSCGCNRTEATKTHGMTKTRTFKSWESMKQRCLNPNATDYHGYGGRGIRVCESWLDGFENFLSDMGERPDGTSLDRVNVNGNYEPGNCRWASRLEQQRNKQNSLLIEWRGVEKGAADWADEVGISAKIIRDRLRAGWTVSDAITKQNRKQKKQFSPS